MHLGFFTKDFLLNIYTLSIIAISIIAIITFTINLTIYNQPTNSISHNNANIFYKKTNTLKR
jgi:hypothetical protein